MNTQVTPKLAVTVSISEDENSVVHSVIGNDQNTESPESPELVEAVRKVMFAVDHAWRSYLGLEEYNKFQAKKAALRSGA